MKSRSEINTRILLIVGIIIIVNILSYSFFVRLDFTRDKKYTLSDATMSILKSMKHPVTVTAYFSENLPPTITQTKTDFKNLLVEYAARAGGKVVYNFINPNKSDTTEREAMKNGINPVMVNIRDKDQMKQQKAYLGAIIKMGDKSEVIPFIQPGTAMEYELSTNIKKLSIDKKPTIGLLQGNGEPTQSELQQVNADLNVLYVVQPVKLSDSLKIPPQYNTLLLVSPKDSFRSGQLEQLTAFLGKGGKLLIAYSGLEGDLRNAQGTLKEVGLRKWLAEKDIILEPKFIIDVRCGSISVQQSLGGIPFRSQLPFPYLPLISNFADHPVTKGLGSVMLPFSADIKFTGDTSKVNFTRLAWSSDKSGLENAPVYFDIEHNWKSSEFPLSKLVVAAAFTGVDGNKDSKIILISNSDFAINSSGQQGQHEQDDIDLFVNSVDWLSDETGLIELRNKGITSSPLKDISDSTKAILRYTNFILPVLLVIGFGAVRIQLKRSKRMKRMEENYES